MTPAENKEFWNLMYRLRQALMLQGKSEKTIDNYCRSIRRLAKYFKRCPVDITVDELKQYFAGLVETHSWDTVRIDRNGFQHFWKHILKKEWNWVDIVKPPQKKTPPDVLSIEEVQRLSKAFTKLHYQVFYLAAYSMGLRLGETLKLEVRDIDKDLMRVHIRDSKFGKDCFVPLPLITLRALRLYRLMHQNPTLIFPCMVGSANAHESWQCQKYATRMMDTL